MGIVSLLNTLNNFTLHFYTSICLSLAFSLTFEITNAFNICFDFDQFKYLIDQSV